MILRGFYPGMECFIKQGIKISKNTIFLGFQQTKTNLSLRFDPEARSRDNPEKFVVSFVKPLTHRQRTIISPSTDYLDPNQSGCSTAWTTTNKNEGVGGRVPGLTGYKQPILPHPPQCSSHGSVFVIATRLPHKYELGQYHLQVP